MSGTRPHPLARLGTVALAITLWVALALIISVCMAAMSSGYAPSWGVFVTMCLAAVVAGTVHGILWHARVVGRAQRAAPIPPTTTGAPPTFPGTALQSRDSVGVLLWPVFALAGVVGSVMLAYIAMKIGANFRGPVIGVWELGTPRYARDQGPVDMAIGGSVAMVGVIAGLLVLTKLNGPRGLAWGFMLGCVTIGCFIAFRK